MTCRYLIRKNDLSANEDPVWTARAQRASLRRASDDVLVAGNEAREAELADHTHHRP
jgi:hypothetical protein